MSYVFDAGSLLLLTRELGGEVVGVIKKQMTASLAFYEIGNAIWKGCRLHKRLNVSEAQKTLSFVYALMNAMKVLDVNDSSLGSDVLANAVKLKITYYDSAYLTLAEKFKAVLVTDDKKLEKASIKAGIKTAASKDFMPSPDMHTRRNSRPNSPCDAHVYR